MNKSKYPANVEWKSVHRIRLVKRAIRSAGERMDGESEGRFVLKILRKP